MEPTATGKMTWQQLLDERADVERALDGKDLLKGESDLARRVLAQRRKLDELIENLPGGDQLLAAVPEKAEPPTAEGGGI